MNELVKFESLEENQAIAVFTKQNGLDSYLQEIEKELESFVPDTTTLKGRKEIASMAAKVSRSKTFLDDAGKKLVSKLKEQPKLIDAERRRVRDWCDAKRDETRQPLTDWENAEKDRISYIEQRVLEIKSYQDIEFQTSDECKDKLNFISSIEVDQSFDEFQEKAEIEKELALSRLSKILESLIEQEEAQRLEEQKRLEAERIAQEEREKQIAKEAEERVKIQAQKEADRVKAEADRKHRESIEAAERREIELKLAAEKAEREKLEAQNRADQAEREALEKVEADKKAIEDAAKSREADKKHRASINNQILDSLLKIGLDEKSAKNVIKAIAKGEIDRVSIF